MNVYDFDGTIYDGDSSVDFWLFCIRRKPSVLLRCLPALLSGALLYSFRLISKEKWKERFFSFLKYIPADEQVRLFWDSRFSGIKAWYLEQKRESDVIVSASPAFLLSPVCRKLGVSLIASEVDSATGRFRGRNCSGEEKVKRFREQYPNAAIEAFYTDSRKDLPLAKTAEKAFFVRKNERQEMNLRSSI